MKGKTLLCLVLVTSMLLSVFMIGSVSAQSTTIGVEPMGVVDYSLGSGSSFTVEIWIRNVADLTGYEFKLRYNTSVLTATQNEYGGIFGPVTDVSYFWFADAIYDGAGYLYYGVSQAFGEPSFNGSGRLAKIHFDVDSSGGSALDLYDTIILDSAAADIAHASIDGYFSNVHLWLHAEAGLINLASPVGTDWHGLVPGYCHGYEITAWPGDHDSSGTLSICDDIALKNKTTSAEATYGVDEVAVTIKTNSTIPVAVMTTQNSPASVPAGTWTNPTNAYSSNDVYASTSTANAAQQYGTYGFSLPSDSAITKVEVGFEAHTAAVEHDEWIGITCSWDGGTSWATEQTSDDLPRSDPDTVTWFDFTGATTWTASKLSNANFRTKVRYIKVGTVANPVYLDWIPVNVAYDVGTTNSPGSTSGGWTNPTNAYADGSGYASITSGTPSLSQVYGGYGFSIPAGSIIDQVKVRYDAWTPGTPYSLTLLPDSAGDETDIKTLVGAATHWEACSTSDGDTSYVEEPGAWARDLFNLQDTAATGTIKSVTVYMTVKGTGAGTGATTSIKTEGNTYDGTAVGVTTSYTTWSTTYTTNPSTTAAWTWTQVNALQAGVKLQKPAGGKKTRATYVWVVVDYAVVDEQIRVDVSWDGGTSWSTKQATTLTLSETTYWYDVTGATSWTPEKLNNTNFRTRVDAYTVGTAAEVRLDWIPVTVRGCLPMYIEFEKATAKKSPSSTSAVVAGWTNPTDAYSSDNSYASTSTADAAQQYGGYGFSIPGGYEILWVQVGYEAYTAGDDGIRISCSWDGGTTWATEQVDATLPTSDQNEPESPWFDFTLATSWTASKLSDANFRTKVSYQYSGGQSTTYLDWITVNVTCICTNSPSSTPAGTWTNPTNAYSSDNSYASTITVDAAQQYGSYGVSIPGGYDIVWVQVGYEAFTDHALDEKIGITCSWDGGTTWATESMSGLLPGSDPNAVTWVDFTTATSWTASKLSNANFRTKVRYVKVGAVANTTYLDWIPVRVICRSPNSPSSTSTPSGTWSNPTNAYSSDNSYASTSTASAAQQYGTYGFSLPSAATIVRVEVGYEAYTAGDDGIRIACSWDGGTTWSTESVVATLPASDPNMVTWVDFTTATSWTASKLSDANFRTKASYQYSGGQSTTYLDWILVRVYYDLLIPDFNWANPLNYQWHEIYPVFSNRYNLTSFTDNGASGLNVGDVIQLKNTATGVIKSYDVKGISTDIIVTKIAHGPAIPEFPLGSVLPIAIIVAVVYVWWINKRKRIIKPQ